MKAGRNFLRHAYFLRELDDSVIDAVARVCGEISFPAGETIFREGERGNTLFILLSGEVGVWKHYGMPDENLLARYQAGRIFGEMALVDELPRSATAVAMLDSNLLYLRRSDFAELVRKYPDLAVSIMKSMSAIVRESNDSFVADLHHRNEELVEAYRKLEKAQNELLAHERLSNLGKMSNMVLHDIRNPVSVLRGYADALNSSANDPERVREFARRVKIEADRLGHLSGELLDYSRGEVRLDLSVCSLTEIITTATGYLDEKFQKGGVELVLDVRQSTSVVVDFQRCVRALLNLIDNARKACAKGGRVTVSVDWDESSWSVRIEDTGEGMSAETKEHMFEPFFSESPKGGSGLGLVVVRNTVEAHGGTLTAESVLGEGTVFVVTVPLKAGLMADGAGPE